MGVYVFETDALISAVCEDASRQTTHNFGRDILPYLVQKGKVLAYPFRDENRKKAKYWRDIGMLDSYYEAIMDLVQVQHSIFMMPRSRFVPIRLRVLQRSVIRRRGTEPVVRKNGRYFFADDRHITCTIATSAN
jgi:ADP-glucose pyrophosphorylase